MFEQGREGREGGTSSFRVSPLERAPRGALFMLLEHVFERLEQAQPSARPPSSTVERRRQPRHDRDVTPAALERCLRAPRALEQVESDRRLVREEAEQLHLLQREPGPLRPVEHLRARRARARRRAAAPT